MSAFEWCHSTQLCKRKAIEFLAKGEVCCSSFDSSSSYLAQGQLQHLCQQKVHTSSSPCQTWKIGKIGSNCLLVICILGCEICP